MANRIDALLAGVGSVREVYDSWIQNLTPDDESYADLQTLMEIMSKYTTVSQGSRAMLAVFAAFANREFMANGKMYRVDKDGNLDFHYVASNAQRDIMSSLFAD